MRCSKCGAASRVLDTREEPQLFRTKRRRRCDNNHVFFTFEVHTQVVTAAGKSKIAQLAVEAAGRAARYARDLKIWLAHSVRGQSYIRIGKAEDMHKSTVQRICERMKKERK